MDRYFKRPGITTIAPITGIEYAEHNHPDALNLDQLYADFEAAVADETNDLVMIEGLFALHLARIREKLDLKVFIDLKSDERLYRRIKRWLEREDIDKISHRYLDTVRFRHDELIEPTRWHADMVINGTLDANKGTEMLLKWIENQL
jgi:uridine kinase